MYIYIYIFFSRASNNKVKEQKKANENWEHRDPQKQSPETFNMRHVPAYIS